MISMSNLKLRCPKWVCRSPSKPVTQSIQAHNISNLSMNPPKPIILKISHPSEEYYSARKPTKFQSKLSTEEAQKESVKRRMMARQRLKLKKNAGYV